MKLKKIASLMLAGVMAVSMLAGCSNGPATSEPTNPVEPVDTSFATAVNAEMGTAAKNVLTFSSDAKLASVLNNVASKIASSTLINAIGDNDGFVITTDAGDFRHLLGIDRANSLALASDGNYCSPVTGNYVGGGNWKYFSNSATSAVTTADLIVVPGNLTEEGVAEYVAGAAEAMINAKRMPATGFDKNNDKDYRYAYTGNIACVKIDNLSGDFSSYVVAVTVTQTPTPVTNANALTKN